MRNGCGRAGRGGENLYCSKSTLLTSVAGAGIKGQRWWGLECFPAADIPPAGSWEPLPSPAQHLDRDHAQGGEAAMSADLSHLAQAHPGGRERGQAQG